VSTTRVSCRCFEHLLCRQGGLRRGLGVIYQDVVPTLAAPLMRTHCFPEWEGKHGGPGHPPTQCSGMGKENTESRATRPPALR
jgi:hypothetical protein